MKEIPSPISIGEIAAELGCSVRTVRRYYARGRLPTFKVGSNTSPIKMSRVDLRAFQKKKGKR
ncbi:helix-turn-helix domain-containing protein [Agrobacterium vaccinii]|uniref:helix-turn-helix domain-containing protein n=1 Tax=Agrobacterium vaccinii TaxID=2735528 RepID=UPI001E59D9DD|nr:helix-turn-helix domain-containing protein [Agrobacterium vaccinii]UHS63763.1 helix-turn-helix domain-containing protein [Agrobacterium vaccinii]